MTERPPSVWKKKLEDLYTLASAKFMYKVHKEDLPSIMMSFFARHDHGYGTRRALIYKPPFYKTALGNKFIKKTGITTWNELTLHIDLPSFSENMFKKYVISYIISTYS